MCARNSHGQRWYQGGGRELDGVVGRPARHSRLAEWKRGRPLANTRPSAACRVLMARLTCPAPLEDVQKDHVFNDCLGGVRCVPWRSVSMSDRLAYYMMPWFCLVI